MTLTLLSYNIHSGVGLDGVLDLGRIADVIAASGADLVALQEVDRHRRAHSQFEDQPGLLAEWLGFHLAYAANLDDGPTVLLGDLNTTPGSTAYTCLAGRLEDAWAVGDGEGHTLEAEPPPRRIDYVWVGGGVRALSAQVIRSDASDHHALRVEVAQPG